MALFDDMFSKLDEIFGSDAPPPILLSAHKQVLRTAEQLYVTRSKDVKTYEDRVATAKLCIGDAEAFWKEALQSVKKSGDWVAQPKKPIPDHEAKEIRVMVGMLEKQMLNTKACELLRLRVNALLDALGYAKDA